MAPTGARAAVDMYEELTKETIDAAFTLYPAKYDATLAKTNAMNKRCSFSSDGLCNINLGPVGFASRSGWYVPANVSAVAARPLAWSSAASLFDTTLQSVLLPASTFPVVNTCWVNNSVGYGVYDCADGSWVAPNSTCCTRADAARNSCGARAPCLAVLVDSPSYDAGVNEHIVDELRRGATGGSSRDRPVGLQIVYGDVERNLDIAVQLDRPVIVYSWVPRVHLMRPNRFVRIDMRDYYSCTPLAIANQVPPYSACGFPLESVEKMVSWKLLQPSSQPIAAFLLNFHLDSDQLLTLLSRYDMMSVNATYDEVACEWLRDNPAVWQAWLPPPIEDSWLAHWRLIFMLCVSAFVWVFVCEPNLLREWDPDGEFAMTGSTRGTTTFGYDCFGFIMRSMRRARAARLSASCKADHIASMPHVTSISNGALYRSLDSDKAQLTFGQTHTIARKGGDAVELVIVRLDALPVEVLATLTCCDASAVFGVDYAGLSMAMQDDGAQSARWTTNCAAKSLSITFQPNERIKTVLVHMRDPKAFSHLSHFFIALTSSATGQGATIAPENTTRITVLDATVFPNDFKEITNLESTLAFEIGTDSETAGYHDALIQMGSSMVWSWKPVYHYLREAFRWSWVVHKFPPLAYPVAYCICQFIVQVQASTSPTTLIITHWPFADRLPPLNCRARAGH